MKLTFKRVYEYGGDCKASDIDYICGYQASNGVMIEKKFTEGLSAIYCWMVGEDYYDTLNAAKNAVIRKANEPEAEPAAQEAANEPEAETNATVKAAIARLTRRVKRETGDNIRDCFEAIAEVHDAASEAIAAMEKEADDYINAVTARFCAGGTEVEPETADEAANATDTAEATNDKEETEMTILLDVHTMNLSATEDEEIFSVKVLWNGGDSWIEYADTAEAMNEWGTDKAVSAWELENGTLNVWLAQPAQEAPDAGEPDALEVVRILGETLNLIKDNGDEVKATKARIALWEQVDKFKRRGVTLNVEYGTDGRFVGVTEPKTGMKFDELPESVQGKVKEYLRAYDDCSVTYERGAYRVSAGVGITARYAPDFKVRGRYAADDIFTPEERVLNYANSFYSYPPEYCGERDYRMMKAAQECGAKLEYDNAGNIVAAA